MGNESTLEGLLLELTDQLGGSNVRNLTQGTSRYYQGILKALQSGDFSVLPQKQEGRWRKPYSKGGSLWEALTGVLKTPAWYKSSWSSTTIC